MLSRSTAISALTLGGTGAALALVVALAGSACGPSFQVVYEGDARFEHCYAVDDTPTVSMQEKTDCWTQWVKVYSYGQTRNRIDYARLRAKALQTAHALPTDEAVMSAAPGGGTGTPVGVNEPVTTNAFASPPKTLNEGDGGRDAQPNESAPAPAVTQASPPSAPIVSAPGQGCTETCQSGWRTCRAACTTPGCVSCDTKYRSCMKKCF